MSKKAHWLVIVTILVLALVTAIPAAAAAWTGSVIPLSLDLPEASIASTGPEIPCGIFDVNGHGWKFVGQADFPACQQLVQAGGTLEVLCLTGDGVWTDESVSGTYLHDDVEIQFLSGQHGICGFFSSK